MATITVSPEEQLAELKRGAEEIISEDELLLKLKESYTKQKPLIVKFGADPSRPDIHLGHTVVLGKLKLLQDFGHGIKFIIGDFTALIGDPTGRSKTRPQLDEHEVSRNAETYKEQIFKILDPKKTDVVYNSHWLNRLTPMDFIKLLASRTVQQLLARDDFSNRYSEQVPIFLHELVYPVMQGYDSLFLQSDIELGGTDQKFNFLLAREMQRQKGQRPQSILLTPILEGLDGVQKMSKSLDNYIGLTDAPNDMFGKTMSISDTLMVRYYELLSRRSDASIQKTIADLKSEQLHPMEAKKSLAQEIVSHYWGETAAKEARQHFESVFSRKETPQDLPIVECAAPLNLINVAIQAKFCETKSEARRVMQQGGMKLNGEAVTQEKVDSQAGDEFVFKFGKLKICRIRVL